MSVKIGPLRGLNVCSCGSKIIVPFRSAGSRSGVNWMRLKSASMVSESVFTASVLASPGTPSIRRWPLQSRPISRRSMRYSCPTMTRLISWTTGAMKSPRRRIASFWTAGRKEAATTGKPRAGHRPAPFHEAAHAVVAVLLGLRARAELHEDTQGCGATDIDAPMGLEGTDRLLVALVAGSEG